VEPIAERQRGLAVSNQELLEDFYYAISEACMFFTFPQNASLGRRAAGCGVRGEIGE
jgi:hypothetical protein